jgi:sirohydrochlorin ferrochelatase
MIVALVDNGSLAPAAHLHLRATAAALGKRTGITVHAVSWKHSDRIAASALDDTPAWTLSTFVRRMTGLGQRDFVFVPYFISAQGAIGSALRTELDALRPEIGAFDFTLIPGVFSAATLGAIAADLVRQTLTATTLRAPAVVIVDHGGPSANSARLRDQVTERTRTLLGDAAASVTAASMEGSHPPLLASRLRDPDCAGADVVVTPLFLSPGRHAGPGGDLDRICAASPARCRRTGLAGSHPLILETLATALERALPTLTPSLSA